MARFQPRSYFSFITNKQKNAKQDGAGRSDIHQQKTHKSTKLNYYEKNGDISHQKSVLGQSLSLNYKKKIFAINRSFDFREEQKKIVYFLLNQNLCTILFVFCQKKINKIGDQCTKKFKLN